MDSCVFFSSVWGFFLKVWGIFGGILGSLGCYYLDLVFVFYFLISDGVSCSFFGSL